MEGLPVLNAEFVVDVGGADGQALVVQLGVGQPLHRVPKQAPNILKGQSHKIFSLGLNIKTWNNSQVHSEYHFDFNEVFYFQNLKI
jgi:hypothetical protein